MEILSIRTIIRPTDLDRSLRFYGEQLGLAVYREFGEGADRGVVYFAGGGLIEVTSGSDEPGPEPPVGPSATTVLWLQVRDIEATVAELAARKVPIARGPVMEPWGLIEAWVDDPDGLRIHVVEVPEHHPLRRDQRASGP